MGKTVSRTDIGLKRKLNQDYVFTADRPVGKLPNLYLVADGMGGHKAGGFASKYTVETVVEVVNCSKDDNYTVTVTDVDGNQVEGLTAVLTNRYDNGVYFSVTGLRFADAAKKYYFKVTHDTLGEPYYTDGSKV